MRRYTVDETAFDQVTPQSAYWAGFLMADGYIRERRIGKGAGFLRVVLQQRDFRHLEKLRVFIGSTHPVRLHTDSDGYAKATYWVRSNRIVTALARFGVVPHKSGRECVSVAEKDRDFWRGYADGDGSIYLREGIPGFSLCGSPTICRQFLAFLQCNGLGNGLGMSSPHSGLVRVGTRGSVAQQVIRLLYDGAVVALDRKWVVAESTRELTFRRWERRPVGYSWHRDPKNRERRNTYAREWYHRDLLANRAKGKLKKQRIREQQNGRRMSKLPMETDE